MKNGGSHVSVSSVQPCKLTAIGECSDNWKSQRKFKLKKKIKKIMLECNWKSKVTIGSFLRMEKIPEKESYLYDGFH